MTPLPEDPRAMSPSGTTTGSDVFYVSLSGCADIPVRDIWPDGDAPANPTVEDVIALMLKSGSLSRLIDDWNLEVEVVEVEDMTNGGGMLLTDRQFREARS